MPKVKQLIRELAKYTMAKPGVRQDSSYCLIDPLEWPRLELITSSQTDFFWVDDEDGEYFARLPVLKDAFKRHRKKDTSR